MLSKKQKQAIFDRLRLAMNGMSRAELSAKMGKSGFPLSVNSLSAYSSGSAAPTSETLLGFNKVLGVSIDWLLTGKHPEHPDITKFEEMLAGAKSVSLSSVPDQDPDVSRILDIVLAMPSEARKKAIEFLELTTMRPKR